MDLEKNKKRQCGHCDLGEDSDKWQPLVDTVIWVRTVTSGSLLWTTSRVMKWREGILGLADNLLASQALCSIELFCSV